MAAMKAHKQQQVTQEYVSKELTRISRIKLDDVTHICAAYLRNEITGDEYHASLTAVEANYTAAKRQLLKALEG